MRQCKHYELRSAKRPGTDPRLSNTAVVVDETGNVGYAYIGFSDSFVAAVGKALPRGINERDQQAYLSVTYNPLRRIWEVSARYINDTGGPVQLWTAPAKPDWINIIKPRGKNGKATSAGG